MSDEVRSFFQEAVSRIDKTRVRGERTYVFEVDSVGSWAVLVNNGRIEVVEDAHIDNCDCVISTSEDTFVRIARKEQNPTMAYMTGKLKIRGNMAAATALLAEMKAHGLL